MKREFVISSKMQYHETMADIYELMNKGETNLTKTESKKLGLMVNAAKKFEDETMGPRPDFKPESLPDMVRLVMLEKKISQARLAEMLK
jgi:hypothetical protein